MAYARLTHVDDHEGLSTPSSSGAPPSPPTHSTNPRSFSWTVEQLTAVVRHHPDEPRPARQPQSRVGSFLRSLTSSHAYQLAAGDDDEQPPIPPLHVYKRAPDKAPRLPGQSTSASHPTAEPTPVRTASVSRHLPLNHPKPDLQSLQGAYVKNIERLEQSAEHLSISSSLDEEIQKIKLEQRRAERTSSVPASTTLTLSPPQHPTRRISDSLSHSIIGVNITARMGGYSPSGYVMSPHDTSAPSWYHAAANPLHAPDICDPVQDPVFTSGPSGQTMEGPHPSRGQHINIENDTDARPNTAVSNDTYHMVKDLFPDFDGVHYPTHPGSSLSRHTSGTRQLSGSHPPVGRDGTSVDEPQPGASTIFYPAPVPVMLNMPQKLSKMSAADRERERVQLLSGIPDEMRKAAGWLQGGNDATSDPRYSVASVSTLPPHLRANVFFEQPSLPQDIQLQDGSAVATLDRILDASARAPVSAFVDHPIAGQLGKEVYGPARSKRKSQAVEASSLRATKRHSKSALPRDKAIGSETAGQPSQEHTESSIDDHASANTDDGAGTGSQEHSGDVSDEEPESFTGRPTTLLAELQMRKAQQEQRKRTAADLHPGGLHSTLLELDAVTQRQQQARRQQPITLAWEDPEPVERQNFDDEDIPLGVLVQHKEMNQNITGPIGLIEKREWEENEPLSQRRARLKGAFSTLSETSSMRADRARGVHTINFPGMSTADIPEPEGETLAQRAKRLRAEKEHALGGSFANGLSGQLGLDITVDQAPPAASTPAAEETLAQRRQRLKQETQANPRLGHRNRPLSHGVSHPPVQSPQDGAAQRMAHYSASFAGPPAFMNGLYAYPPPTSYGPSMPLPYNGFFARMPPHENAMMNAPLDSMQREMIDRWRQSVV